MSNHHIFLKSGFFKNPSQNGIGRYVCQLQRVVLKFCKDHGDSRGMRDFIERDLISFAKENPGTVVYLKPRRHRGPVIIGEYLNGDRQWIYCKSFSSEDISKWLNLLKTQARDSENMRLRKLISTQVPSIQGPWTPFTFRDPAVNLAEFPNKELSKTLETEKSATEILLEIFERQQKEKESVEN